MMDTTVSEPLVQLPAAQAQAPLTVVCVDDNEVNLLLFRRLVERMGGCRVVPFPGSLAALDWCGAHLPDLLIVDYMMPDMDGLELIQRFRTLPGREELPVLMVTADRANTTRYEALNNGATDFLTKPIDHVEFTARVRNMLAIRRAQKMAAERQAWLAEEVAKATASLVQRERETLHCLGVAAEYRDPETGQHLMRMARYSRLIAARLGFPDAEQETLLLAAPMHDVGKLGIPDHILLKPGKLTDEEMALMRTHPEIGYRILGNHGSPILQAGAVIAEVPTLQLF